MRPSPEPAIRLSDVSVRYDEHIALDAVSVEFRSGEVTALSGSNGSGKSTLLGAIAGTVPLANGTVAVESPRVAYVVQRSSVPDHLPLTVRQAVQMGHWAHRGVWGRLTRDDRDITSASIAALGLDGLERRALGSLSGGQRQRVFVAQGLAQRADILLLDEPTIGLDETANELITLAIAAEAERGVAVVHATHDPQVIHLAHRHVQLGAGRIVEATVSRDIHHGGPSAHTPHTAHTPRTGYAPHGGYTPQHGEGAHRNDGDSPAEAREPVGTGA
jgi:zinc/manganese transport system ATP-binding protein